uniref:Rad4 beta-hairpin domain-containing protein n=1 Tax=Anopheles farauti TaxID=69004 RepID=A0A182QNX0_9DIPT
MSDTFMSDSEDEAGDFSASEDEWLPGKSDGKLNRNRSDASESDSVDSVKSDILSEDDTLISISDGRRKGKKTAVHKSTTVRKSNSNAVGEFKRSNKNGTRKKAQADSESSDSGNEHLVDPTKLDLNSKFFDAVQPKPSVCNTIGDGAPTFDCNAGLGKLSDSSDEENESPGPSTTKNGGKNAAGKALIAKINETSQAYVNFQSFTKTLEQAKSHLESVVNNQQKPTQGGTLDVSHLLALGETSIPSTDGPTKTAPTKQRKGRKQVADSDSDWEEVEEGAAVAGPSVGARQTVQITLQPELAAQRKPKKKCTEIDVEACIKRMINKEKRDAQLVLHKVTIIMGIAHGNYTNTVLNNPALLAIGNALIPSERCYPNGRTSLQYFEQIMRYYRDIVDLKDRRMFVNSWKKLSLEESLRLQLLSQMANCKRDYILLFIILLRSIGIQCRMIMSLQVVPKKASPVNYAEKNNPKSTEKSLVTKEPAIIPSPGKKIVKIERFNSKTRKLLDNRVLSTDEESTPKRTHGKQNIWIEAYAEEEERWIPMDVTRGTMQCVDELVQHASSPMLYVLAWNNDGSIKDVTARYCADYLTVAVKLRIMQQWMDNVLCAFRGDRTTRDIAEDRELSRILEERPLPRTISEYKNHPYFALKRHLLKFEAIYPPDAPTLGFTSGKEPVYARECVHTLHAREVWLKQARTVKLYETPYKVVSGRPKYDRTEEYEPPTAEDGIVPRNAYGNVELFKPCMLPKKTVHLRRLNRICKKLHIDCAQAVTGFDFHGGSSHPVYDGFVVCEEFRDVVVDAWHQEQEAEELRAREKYEKRVYGNWKRLIKGLLIRRKLQHKYNFDNLNQ